MHPLGGDFAPPEPVKQYSTFLFLVLYLQLVPMNTLQVPDIFVEVIYYWEKSPMAIMRRIDMAFSITSIKFMMILP